LRQPIEAHFNPFHHKTEPQDTGTIRSENALLVHRVKKLALACVHLAFAP
jgi:hypothetical protein